MIEFVSTQVQDYPYYTVSFLPKIIKNFIKRERAQFFLSYTEHSVILIIKADMKVE